MIHRPLALFAISLLFACGGTTTASSGADDAGSGGAAGTGGSSGTGGAIGTGGATGVGGSSGAVCPSATVTFKIDRAAVTPPDAWCLGAPVGCSSQWLSIKDPAGKTLSLSNMCGTPCDSCMPMGCPAICAMPNDLAPGGTTTTWDGKFFVPSTCGASAMSCQSPSCAVAGRYTAVMCGFPKPSPDAGFGCSMITAVAQTCVEVAFDFPAQTSVTGTLPAQIH
jgi:hypothetical protein